MDPLVKKIVFASLLLTMPLCAFAEEVTVTVKGMVCSFCAQGIKKTFSKEENVSSIEVDLDKKLVTLQLKDGKATDDQLIEKTIKDAGYDVLKIEMAK